MNNEFKPGDLVFELTTRGEVLLSKLSYISDDCVSTDIAAYTSEGINEQLKVSRLFHATSENRSALAALYGEDEVPQLPLEGSELTKKLLEKQKYVLCFCSDTNDDDCREIKRPLLITGYEDGYFYEGKADVTFVTTWRCAVPIDMHGNEITEMKQ